MAERPRWDVQNSSDLRSLGIIASKTIRSPGVPYGVTLKKLLEDHLRTFQKWFLFVTWGTYFDTFLVENEYIKLYGVNSIDQLAAYNFALSKWNTKWPSLKHGYSLRPGKRGGVLQMAEHLEPIAGTDTLGALIFLTDPKDLEEGFPEDRALIRSAVRNNVVYLPTYRAAEHWAAYEASGVRKARHPVTARSEPKKETLALIAHDGKKLNLCRWVVEHRNKLSQFKSFVTTGTTGHWVKQFLEASGVAGHKIDLIETMASGPQGGDVEISGEILRGNCHHVVFFVDPDTPHAHEADIQALLRVCSMPEVSVNLRLNENSATSWIRTL